MRITEYNLRSIIRGVIRESVGMVDVEDIKLRAIEGKQPYDNFGSSLSKNPSVSEINHFVYTYCFLRKETNKDLIERYIEQVAGAVAINNARTESKGTINGENVYVHEEFLDLPMPDFSNRG